MKKCLLLLIVSALVFSFSTPTYATFWKSGKDRDNRSNKSWDNNKDWPKFDWQDNNWPKFDFPKNDWPKGHEHTRHCGHKDNPVPEPATAGLAFMGLGALSLATRRRK